MYEWLGICLALALLFALNALVTFAVSCGWRLVAPRANKYAGIKRARLLFALRVLPAVVALCVVALLLPAYLIHEPREAAETVSLKLAALAILSAAGLLLAIWRGVAAWWTTRRLVRNWLSCANPIKLAGVTIPAYRLSHPFPVLAVVGLWRPRLFIAEPLLTALEPEELQAALAHELGHLAACDNLKRTALRVCRDLLTLVPSGRALDVAWAEAAEAAADEYAVAAQPSAALALATALVKIARCAPAGWRAALPVQASFIASPICVTDSRADNLVGAQLTRRVKRLLQLAEGLPVVTSHAFQLKHVQWIAVSLLVLALALLTSNPLWSAAVHELNEVIVFALQ